LTLLIISVAMHLCHAIVPLPRTIEVLLTLSNDSLGNSNILPSATPDWSIELISHTQMAPLTSPEQKRFHCLVVYLCDYLAVKNPDVVPVQSIYTLYHPSTHITLQEFIIMFGAVQLILSQLPDIHALRHINILVCNWTMQPTCLFDYTSCWLSYRRTCSRHLSHYLRRSNSYPSMRPSRRNLWQHVAKPVLCNTCYCLINAGKRLNTTCSCAAAGYILYHRFQYSGGRTLYSQWCAALLFCCISLFRLLYYDTNPVASQNLK